MATSKANNVIGVMWTRSSDDTGPDTLIVNDQTASTTTPTVTTSTATQMDFTGVQGHMYSIVVASSGGRSSAITWMTAVRSSSINLFPVDDLQAGANSGLQLNGSGGLARSLSFTGTNTLFADFLLDTTFNDPRNPSGLVFESALVWDTTLRHTKLDSVTAYVSGGLDNAYLAGNLSSYISTNGTTLPGRTAFFIPNTAVTGDKILIARTPEGNYAKIAIKQQANGMLYSTDASNHKFITVDVSYQTMAGMPYAARPIPTNGIHVRGPRIPVE